MLIETQTSTALNGLYFTSATRKLRHFSRN